MKGVSAAVSTGRRRYSLPPAAAGLAFCAIILWCLAGNLLFPHYGFFRYETVWALAAAGAVLLLMTGLYFALRGVRPILLRHPFLSKLGWAIVWAGLFTLQVRLAYAVRLPADWDARAIYSSAAGLARGTRESIDYGYFSLNPNNILLTLLLAAWFSFVTSLGITNLETATAFLNAVVLFAGIALTYAAARMLGGRILAAFTLLPSTIFVLLSPWLGVFYSDSAGLLFPVLILCLLLAAQRVRSLAARIVLWVLAGTAGAAGYGIKPTVLICLLAAGITAACSPALRGRGRGAAILLLGAAVVAGSFFAGHRLITAAEQQGTAVGFDVQANPNALPPTHFLKVGAHVVPGKYGPLYGSYNEADVSSTAAAGGPHERFQHGLNAYAERVEAMGPGGYVSFLNNKLLWITGDGSFFAWGEGVLDGDDFVSDDPADQSIQDVFGYGNPGFPWLFTLWQGTWFVVLGLAAVPLFLRTPALMLPEVSALRIALLGLLVFLLLSEGRARFLYLYIPYFILLASLSFFAVMERVSPGRVPDGRGAAQPGGRGKGREVIE